MLSMLKRALKPRILESTNTVSIDSTSTKSILFYFVKISICTRGSIAATAEALI